MDYRTYVWYRQLITRKREESRKRLDFRCRILSAIEKMLDLEIPYDMREIAHRIGYSPVRVYHFIEGDAELNRVVALYRKVSRLHKKRVS